MVDLPAIMAAKENGHQLQERGLWLKNKGNNNNTKQNKTKQKIFINIFWMQTELLGHHVPHVASTS